MSFRRDVEDILSRIFGGAKIEIISYNETDSEINVVFKVFDRTYRATFTKIAGRPILSEPPIEIDRESFIQVPRQLDIDELVEEEASKVIEEIEKTPKPPELGVDYCRDLIEYYRNSVLNFLEKFQVPVEVGDRIEYRYLHEVDFMNKLIFFRRLVDYFMCKILERKEKSLLGKYIDYYQKYTEDREAGRVRFIIGPFAVVRMYARVKVLCFDDPRELNAFKALMTFLESLIAGVKTFEFSPDSKGVTVKRITVVPPYLKELEYIHAFLSLTFDGKCIKSFSYDSALKTFNRISEILWRIYMDYNT